MARAGVYNVIRKTHLYAGLVLLVFVVMYFVTGYPITHNQWFDAQDPVKTERTVATPSIEADDLGVFRAPAGTPRDTRQAHHRQRMALRILPAGDLSRSRPGGQWRLRACRDAAIRLAAHDGRLPSDAQLRRRWHL